MTGKSVLAVIRAARPDVRSAMDKVAFALHAAVMTNGYMLVGVGETCTDEAPPPDAAEIPAQGWNAQDGVYTFKYTPDSRKGPSILVKALIVDSSLLASFLALTDSASPETLELDVSRYTAEASDLASGYQNMDELAQRVEWTLASIQPQDSEKSIAQPSTTEPSTTANVSPLRRPLDDPLRDPDFRPPFPTHDPLLVGGSDLDPLHIGRPGIRNPYPGEGMPDLGGGMHVGPDHPFFRDHLRNPQIRPGMTPPGVPPGSRWDPIRPPGMEGFDPRDFQRRPDRGVHPDIGPPPGQGSNWDNMFG